MKGTLPQVATEKPAQAKVLEHMKENFHDMNKMGDALKKYSQFMLHVVEDSEQNGSVAATSNVKKVLIV